MKYALSMLAAVLVAGLVQFAAAGDCCQRCGCQCACRPVTCKIVCETKKVKDYFYVCECEDFCLPGPGRKTPACCDCCAASVEQPCAEGCGDCGCGSCGCLPKFCHKHCLDFIYKPECCHLYHRKILKKYECEREVPCYKCVVVELCPSCCQEVSACAEGGEEMYDGKAPKDEKKPVPPKLPSAARRGGLFSTFLGKAR